MEPDITLDENGVIVSEIWRYGDGYHRVGEPACRIWRVVNGTRVLTCEVWWLEGRRHRVDGPASRWWTVVNGTRVLTCEHWVCKDKTHRTDGPAYRWWRIVNGRRQLAKEEWSYEGNLVRWDGPASRVWDLNGYLSALTYRRRGEDGTTSLESIVIRLQRWMRRQYKRRWRMIECQLRKSGLVVWPGLMGMLRSY